MTDVVVQFLEVFDRFQVWAVARYFFESRKHTISVVSNKVEVSIVLKEFIWGGTSTNIYGRKFSQFTATRDILSEIV